MNSLRLSSAQSDVVLEFSNRDGDLFWAAVSSRDHSATLRVDGYTDAHGVARFFAEAARDWRGWSGDKVWESLVGELRLAMSIDRLGHVTLTVRLRHDFGGPDSWRLDAELSLEAGQLEAIARDAARFWGDGV